MSEPPILNGETGRDDRGRFVNHPGPGAPPNKHRARLAKAIKGRDITKAVQVLREIMNDPKAKAADRIAAAREMLDRSCGKPVQADLLERIEGIEQQLGIAADGAKGKSEPWTTED